MVSVLVIPRDRVGVLIGRNGNTKKRIERLFDAKLEIRKDGLVKINECPPENLIKLMNVIRAIGLGFNPDIATELARDDVVLYVIDLSKRFSKEHRIRQIKGRIIGRKGRIWREIERATETYISVYGDYVSIIGDQYGADAAREAIKLIMDGVEFATLFRFLEKKKIELVALRYGSH